MCVRWLGIVLRDDEPCQAITEQCPLVRGKSGGVIQRMSHTLMVLCAKIIKYVKSTKQSGNLCSLILFFNAENNLQNHFHNSHILYKGSDGFQIDEKYNYLKMNNI